jgi:hypothetical protein
MGLEVTQVFTSKPLILVAQGRRLRGEWMNSTGKAEETHQPLGNLGSPRRVSFCINAVSAAC